MKLEKNKLSVATVAEIERIKKDLDCKNSYLAFLSGVSESVVSKCSRSSCVENSKLNGYIKAYMYDCYSNKSIIKKAILHDIEFYKNKIKDLEVFLDV